MPDIHHPAVPHDLPSTILDLSFLSETDWDWRSWHPQPFHTGSDDYSGPGFDRSTESAYDPPQDISFADLLPHLHDNPNPSFAASGGSNIPASLDEHMHDSSFDEPRNDNPGLPSTISSLAPFNNRETPEGREQIDGSLVVHPHQNLSPLR